MSKYSAIAALSLFAAACRHVAGPGVTTANEIIVDRYGVPSFQGQVYRCPSSNGEGTIQLTYDNGKKRVKGECHGGVMVGDWTGWWTNGAVAWTARLESGRLVGKFESFYANDRKMAVAENRDGLLDGKVTAWWDNGKKKVDGQYVGGKKNGCWETWHENGEKATKGTWSDDRQVATWLAWTPTGDKSKQTFGGEAAHGQCLVTF